MRAEDVIVEASAEDLGEELTTYLDVRPMSSRPDPKPTDLLVHNAIRLDRAGYAVISNILG